MSADASTSGASKGGCAHSICGMLGDIKFADPEVPEGHPEWYPLVEGEDLGLKVHNSLTERIDAFKPAQGRRVLWYTCGPTVYDYCHMGHARAYLTFDILRRIVEDYFGYNVLYHSNITDIDDKIITRARENKLFDDYVARIKSDNLSLETVIAKVQLAIDNKRSKMEAKEEELATPPEDKTSRAQKEYEEEKKTFALKYSQFIALTKGVETVLNANSDLSATELQLLQSATQLGLDAQGSLETAAKGAAALREKIIYSDDEPVEGAPKIADVELLQTQVRYGLVWWFRYLREIQYVREREREGERERERERECVCVWASVRGCVYTVCSLRWT